eukprot:scaffold202858_cov41-Tisochrysis_lutea.AAC.2
MARGGAARTAPPSSPDCGCRGGLTSEWLAAAQGLDRPGIAAPKCSNWPYWPPLVGVMGAHVKDGPLGGEGQPESNAKPRMVQSCRGAAKHEEGEACEHVHRANKVGHKEDAKQVVVLPKKVLDWVDINGVE